MARELKMNIWCDFCQVEDIQTEGEELPPIAVGAGKARVLAACKQHREDNYEPFVSALLELGVIAEHLGLQTRSSPPGQAPKPKTGIECPRCARVLKNRDSLASHLRDRHETTLSEVFGDQPILDVAGNELPPARKYNIDPDRVREACPEKGCDTVYEFPKHTRPKQALAVHVSRLHGKKLAEYPNYKPAKATA